MKNYIERISRYFRQSLIDSDRLCPEDKDVLPVLGEQKQQDPSKCYVGLPLNDWVKGAIDPELAERIIESRQPENKPPLQQLEIVLFPRVDYLKYAGGDRDSRKRLVMLPLVVFANLHRDGRLSPTEKVPWIPRIWIGPTQSANEPFTEMALIDEFLTQNSFDGINDWSQLVAYCTRFLCHVAGVSYQEKTEQNLATHISDVHLSNEYQQSHQCLLQLDTPIRGAKSSLIKTLDFIIDKSQFPRLYSAYCCRQDAQLIAYSDKQSNPHLAKQHAGQMTGEFPLSDKQRSALHYFIEQKDGEILAVNGPPGTGKTTLLRSVVANLWTKAALEEVEPPLIMATSNNNQAVTNILESFAKIDEEGLDEGLKGRWLPKVDSYGLYFCSKVKANSNNPYLYSGPKNEGCMKEWQTQSYVREAKDFFLRKLSNWQQDECTSIDRALTILHQAMLETQGRINQGIDTLTAWQSALASICERYGSVELLATDVIPRLEAELKEKKKLLDQAEELRGSIYDFWVQRSFWVTLLLWIPYVQNQEQRKTRRFLNYRGWNFNSYADDDVEANLEQLITARKSCLDGAQRALSEAEKSLFVLQQYEEKLNHWLGQVTHITLFGNSIAEKVTELNDRFYRFRLFKLATHYFEARWLKETKIFVDKGDEDKKSPFKLIRKLRRYAKLTPCFVSTFYMVPTTFLAGEYKDECWTDLPQLEAIDLLIVDEAGQALPDVSAASFAMAKRALIVGDTDQIEPVWSLPRSVDRSNLMLFGLLADEKDYLQWLDSGLLASCGNLMRVAQRQCEYHQFENLQRGLYLTEHRRCFDNIIEYCNYLVYQGHLEPRRGDPKTALPWDHLSMIPVYSASQSIGGSRGNIGEAETIANWVVSEAQNIVDYARSQDSKLETVSDMGVLCKAVGVVTPFSQQARLIRGELRKVGVTSLTVGTVHSLQGDERLIVLFSSVYGENDKNNGKFYDAGHNMLNVAVSRAKDAFIVFGHPNVFGNQAASSPSGLLRKRLTVKEEALPL